MRKAVVVLLALVAVLGLVAVATASPATSAAAAPVAQGTTPVASAPTRVETCTICHGNTGATHQQFYDQLYQDGVVKVTDVKYSFTANPNTAVVTFNMTKNGKPFDPTKELGKTDELSIYYVPFAGGKFQFDPARDRLSLKGKITSDGNGGVTSTLAELPKTDKNFVALTDLSKTNGVIAVYGRNETQGTIPGTRVRQNKYPFAAVLTLGTVDYTSAANNAGCVKCHTDPYLKHGYIYAQVNKDPKTDFVTCKVCHLDNGSGGHFEWQLLVNDPELAAKFLGETDEAKAEAMLTEDQKKAMAYTTSVMNDVHMSHAMEFPYPQSMSNCVTCHEGKLDTVLSDANMTGATCKSCHPVTGAVAKVAKEGDTPAYDTTKIALTKILPASHPKINWADNADPTMQCSTCHKATGGMAPAFNKIHTGYDTAIYNAAGVKYSDAVSTTISSVAFKDNKLTIQFGTAAKSGFTDIDVSKAVTPTVLVGLYGWDTKDFLFGPHERTFDDNKDGKMDASDARNLEAALGDKVANPRLSIKSTGAGKWEAVADLTFWAPQIKDGSVKRAEVGVLTKAMAGKTQVAVDATTRTVDLGKAAFDDKAFSPIAETQKCETCHAKLATTFHNPSYGGDVTACRLCHITKAGGSHLELQSRSIDSYVHAIHSMQYFDVANIDFKDPYQALKYEEHITMPYPTHGVTNCESCHAKGTYNPPSQDESLPGLLSASSTNASWGRNIGSIPSTVVGPAERACGGCHRAQAINEDKAGELQMLTQHFEQGGYVEPAGKDAATTLMNKINAVMALFK